MKFNLSLKNKTFFPFLKYNLYKFIKQKSTYITIIIYILLNLMLLIAIKSYALPEIFDMKTAKIVYFILYFFYSSAVIGFVGVKANYVLKDEITDGTILIFSTLGQSRKQIIFQKWLAYQIIIISYILVLTFLTSIIYMLGFTNNSTAVIYILNKTWQLILILIFMELLVSSLALLLSYSLSPKAVTSFLLIFSFINFFSYYVEIIFIYPFDKTSYQKSSNILSASEIYNSVYNKNKVAEDIYREELNDRVNNFDNQTIPFSQKNIGNIKALKDEVKDYQINFRQYFGTLKAIDKWSESKEQKMDRQVYIREVYINEGFNFLKKQGINNDDPIYQNLDDKKDFLLKQFAIIDEIFEIMLSENGFLKTIFKKISLDETLDLVKKNNYGDFFIFVTGNLTYYMAKIAVVKYDDYSRVTSINSLRSAISFFNMPKQWFSIYNSINNDDILSSFGLNFSGGVPMNLKFINASEFINVNYSDNDLYIADFSSIREFFPVWAILIYHSILITITLYFYFRIYNRKNLI